MQRHTLTIGQRKLGIGCALLPLTTVQAVSYHTGNFLAGSIATGEGHLRQLILAHLTRQVTRQGCGLGAQGQRHRATVGLACHIGHNGLDHKVIEHRLATQIIGQQHGHLNGKCSVISRCGLCFVHNFFLQATAHVTSLPVAGV